MNNNDNKLLSIRTCALTLSRQAAKFFRFCSQESRNTVHTLKVETQNFASPSRVRVQMRSGSIAAAPRDRLPVTGSP